MTVVVGQATGLSLLRQASGLSHEKTTAMADDRTAGHFRYPGLDFLRALAIVLVVNCHATGAFGSPPDLRVLELRRSGEQRHPLGASRPAQPDLVQSIGLQFWRR